MANKKKTGPKPLKKVLGQLTEVQYWKYNFACENLHHEHTKIKLIQKAKALHESEQMVAELKGAVCNGALREQNRTWKVAEADYFEIKKAIEKELNHPLDGCIISPEDFSVTKEG